MNETMTYADAFTRAFARKPEFLTFLQTMQDRSRRERQPAPLLAGFSFVGEPVSR